MEERDMAKAKYDTAQLKAMLADGEAFKDAAGEPSFPIADEEDLKNAVRAVGRAGADHDAVRKYIIGRADALKLADLISDDWAADGSLKSESKAAPACWQRRAAGMTYNDAARVVQTAIIESLPSNPGGAPYVYVCDMTDSWAVYETDFDGDYTQVDYTIGSDGTVTLGEPVPVARKTVYQPLPAKPAVGRSAIRLPAVPKRAFTSLVEQPPAHTAQLEIRMDTAADSTAAQFRGYAATTDESYAVNDWVGEYRETINPGAFAKTLREQRAIPLLFNHAGMPMASTGSDTCRLSEDSRGLLAEADLDRRQALTNDLCIALERRDVSKMSFSFRAVKDGWNDAYDERSVAELALYDTSIVTNPANPGTTAELLGSMRSALGREGVALMWSVRSAVAGAAQHRVDSAAEPVVEQALRALGAADEAVCRQYGQHGRARTFVVASLMLQVREGRVLSSANEKLLTAALAALNEADDHLTGIDTALDEGQKAISAVLGVADPDGGPEDPDDSGNAAKANSSGMDGDQGGGSSSKNPMMPADGAGPRSDRPRLAAARAMLAAIDRPGR